MHILQRFMCGSNDVGVDILLEHKCTKIVPVLNLSYP